jgi:hypothetical protein
MSRSPFIYVLLLNYNGKHLLEESIPSYLYNNYENFKVVVIDNGSKDGSVEWVIKNYPEVKLLVNDKNLGYSGGFNVGLDYAFNEKGSKYALVSNNDVRADKNIIQSLINLAEQKDNVGFVTGKVFYYDKPNILHTVGKRYDPFWWNGGHIGMHQMDKGQYDVDRELDWCDDIYWLVSKKVYDDVGGYDTEFFLQAEDFDWQARAKKAGYKLYFSHHAKLWHKTSSTLGQDSPFKAYFDARNALIVHMRHRKKHEYLPIIKVRGKQYIKISIKSLLKFRFYYVFKMWKGYFKNIIESKL